jgi:tRNA(Arg) A34 adenosine deaminase TadA
MHETFMRRAFEIARQSLAAPGAMPYGAVVVRDGQIIGEGLNQTAALHDPTSHGEIEAVRDACRRLANTRLDGAVVYTTCEPCAMCVATMYLAGIAGVYYASSLAESGAAMGRLAARDPKWQRKIGADDLRRETGLPLEARSMNAVRLLPEDGAALLEDFVRARMT